MSRVLAALGLILCACGGQIADENLATRTVGTVKGDPGAAGSTAPNNDGVLTATPGATRCNAVTPFSAEFDRGFDSGFEVVDPGAFTIEDKSLRIVPSAQSALTHVIGGACQLTVSVTVRSNEGFQKDGGAILRVDAGARRFALVVTEGQFAIDEEVDASSPGASSPTSDFTAGEPFGKTTSAATTLTVTFDVTEHLIRAHTKPLDGEGVAAIFKMDQPNGALAGPEVMTSVSLGATLGADYIGSSASDFYWIDGFSLM